MNPALLVAFARHTTRPRAETPCAKRLRTTLFFSLYTSTPWAQAMHALFPDKIVYGDEKSICTMLFEAVLFEDNSAGTTPFPYFVQNAPLSPNEKRLYETWRTHTRYEFVAVEK